MTQEFGAIREGVRMLTDQINVLVSLLQPPVNPASAETGAGGATGPLAPVPLPGSPARYYAQAWNDYMSSRYDIAIEGFREVVEKFPGTPDAAKAQFHVGEAFYQQGKCREALPEYQKVAANYKDSEFVPDAYLMQGVCYQDLNQAGNARKMFELVRDRYPNSTQAIQATQKLRGMGVIR
jgi:tol-pal system protein YbgF